MTGEATNKKGGARKRWPWLGWEPSKGKNHNLNHILDSCGSWYASGKFYLKKKSVLSLPARSLKIYSFAQVVMDIKHSCDGHPDTYHIPQVPGVGGCLQRSPWTPMCARCPAQSVCRGRTNFPANDPPRLKIQHFLALPSAVRSVRYQKPVRQCLKERGISQREILKPFHAPGESAHAD